MKFSYAHFSRTPRRVLRQILRDIKEVKLSVAGKVRAWIMVRVRLKECGDIKEVQSPVAVDINITQVDLLNRYLNIVHPIE